MDMESLLAGDGLVLDRRTRMMFDAKHIFINGEGFVAAGRDATLIRHLANERSLTNTEVKRLSIKARELVLDWYNAGWLHVRGI
jgi:50S ribosomal protein L16 3-hydroxylase